jgi:hypothetical protein
MHQTQSYRYLIDFSYEKSAGRRYRQCFLWIFLWITHIQKRTRSFPRCYANRGCHDVFWALRSQRHLLSSRFPILQDHPSEYHKNFHPANNRTLLTLKFSLQYIFMFPIMLVFHFILKITLGESSFPVNMTSPRWRGLVPGSTVSSLGARSWPGCSGCGSLVRVVKECLVIECHRVGDIMTSYYTFPPGAPVPSYFHLICK